ncbi:MAG: YbbR-like domain-containing protein [Mediterranea sp.]|jgi:hypothetical protein|nr:YbbR-like domain-containing protein [Mediterranea sp.]
MHERRDDIKRICSQLYEKTKSFLLSKQSRQFLVFLFFFVVAAGFWLLQTLNRDYETEIGVPLRLVDLPENVVITSPPPTELRLRVRDKGTVLVNYLLGKGPGTVELSFADYRGTDNRVSVPVSTLEKQILNRLPGSTVILGIRPESVDYIYSEGKAKRVPIRLRGKVAAGMQYYVSDTLFAYDSVQVYAPANILDTLRTAYTEAVRVEGIADTTRLRVAFAHVEGAKFVPDAVDVTFPVDIYTEKTVEVPIVGVGFPTEKDLRTFPSKVQVTFQVGLKHFQGVKASDFGINVSYDELLKLGADKYTVKLAYHPTYVSHIRVVPAQVDFLIEQNTAANGD